MVFDVLGESTLTLLFEQERSFNEIDKDLTYLA